MSYGWWIGGDGGHRPICHQVDLQYMLGVEFDSRFDMGVSEQAWAIMEGLDEVPRRR